MIREFICVLCPNGCEISVELDENNSILELEGATCQRGGEYVQQELFAPQRNIATSIKVIRGNMPLVSVRLTDAIPKERIFDVMDEIKKVKLEAPVNLGQVIIKDVLGLNRDVIATKQVLRK
ncbi:MAG: molybdopterin oxidoreductase [Gracilibacter sp. BRH_c7a]|nr:MAG: molybdopterin oxidoreductase [Gracilibacter sp. BRH_c7a]